MQSISRLHQLPSEADDFREQAADLVPRARDRDHGAGDRRRRRGRGAGRGRRPDRRGGQPLVRRHDVRPCHQPSPGRSRTWPGLAVRNTSLRSVWFINSLRGSLALAAAVAVADLATVQHGFWVVLGTLSVLRTNASRHGLDRAASAAGHTGRVRDRRCADHGDRDGLVGALGGAADRRVRCGLLAGHGAVRGRPGRVHRHDRGPVQPAGPGGARRRRGEDRGRRDRLRGQPARGAAVLAARACPRSWATTWPTRSVRARRT